MSIKKRFFVIVILMAAFSGCQQDENVFKRLGPVIRPTVPVTVFRQEQGETVRLNFEIRAINGVRNVRILLENEPWDEVNFDEVDLIYTYSFNYTVADVPDNTRFNFTIEAVDQEGQTAQPFSFTIEAGPPFSIIDTAMYDTPVRLIRGRVNRDITLDSANIWVIDGLVSVEGNRTLTINAGTTVLMRTFTDQRSSRLAITQGCKINAIGNAYNPIVFTSDRTLNGTADWGDWSGIFLYGNAPTNQGQTVFERDFFYGGTNISDNSGELRYVRIEYAGKNDDDAIQFYGVGSGTKLSYINVWNCLDNGIRFKGGAANLKYAVVIDHGAYGLWAEHGWKGKGQFWVFQTSIAATIIPVNFNNIARSVELRNDGNNFLLTPATYTYLSNITMIGNGNTDLDGTRRGFRARTGAMGKVHNVAITNFPDDGARVEDIPETNIDDGTMTFANVRSWSNRSNFDELVEDYIAPNPAYNVTEDPIPGIGPENIVGSVPSNFDPASDPEFGSWFTSAPFIGAIENEDNDWTSFGSWCKNLDGSIR